jgi:hypothetical protein
MHRKQPERSIQLQIIKYLKLKGFVVGKIKTTGARRGKFFILDPYQFKGVPDLLIFTPALAFIEVKAGKNKQSPDQITFQKLCESSGTRYLLAYSLDDIIKIFP